MRTSPLISMVVLCYNHEQFVGEAMHGALSQTYSPLEIIVSDDCSSDRTFEVVQQIAAGYDGPHTIKLNRNPSNLGISGNLNLCVDLACGEYIVVAAGDDVSMPERVQRTQAVFAAANGTAMAVFSDMMEVDANAEVMRRVSTCPANGFDDPVQCCRKMLAGITGASAAWHRKIFDMFGPLQPDVVFEDRVIAFRASLLGRIRHVPEPLVRYRRHEANTVAMFYSADLRQERRRIDCFLSAYRNCANDLETFVNAVHPDFSQAARCRREIRRRIRKLEAYRSIYNGAPLRMIGGLIRLTLYGGNAFRGVKLCLRVVNSKFAPSAP